MIATEPEIIEIKKAEHTDNYKIKYGDLIWGDYEMCFPIADSFNLMEKS